MAMTVFCQLLTPASGYSENYPGPLQPSPAGGLVTLSLNLYGTLG